VGQGRVRAPRFFEFGQCLKQSTLGKTEKQVGMAHMHALSTVRAESKLAINLHPAVVTIGFLHLYNGTGFVRRQAVAKLHIEPLGTTHLVLNNNY